MKSIEFENVNKIYPDQHAVKDLNLKVKGGERLILLGPSGCGKSTILRMIAGLESITSGNLYMGGKRMNDVESGERKVSMVFQNYALYPHMTVEENICYALRRNGYDKKEIKERLTSAVEILHLENYLEKYPKELSGGQQQRVALARAIVKQSDYFLLDEPLSNLDARLRVHARKELVKLHEVYKNTFVYVTHDQVEAMTVGQRVAILRDGVLQMCDTPENIYQKPRNVFVATFIGSPPANILSGRLHDGHLDIAGAKIPLPDPVKKKLEELSIEKPLLGIRPENLHLSRKEEEGTLEVEVNYTENYGERTGVFCSLGEKEVVFFSQEKFKNGERISLKPEVEKGYFFHPESEQNIFS